MSIKEERARSLIRNLTLSVVVKDIGIEKTQSGTVAHIQMEKVRLEDLDALIDAFLRYEFWLGKESLILNKDGSGLPMPKQVRS